MEYIMIICGILITAFAFITYIFGNTMEAIFLVLFGIACMQLVIISVMLGIYKDR